MKGRFIVLEGPDGSGTTTHAKMLAERMHMQKTDVLLTCEPTDGPIGVFIREQLFLKTMSAEALQILFTADRAWHVHNVLIPALNKGKTVVCERYWLSTVIYAEALGINPDALALINKAFVQPDAQVFLLPPLDVCLERLGKRPTRDMLEEDSLQKRVYEGYVRKAAELSIPIVDTSGTQEEAAEAIDRALQL